MAEAKADAPEAQFRIDLDLRHSKRMLEGALVDNLHVIDLYERTAAQGHVGASFALAALYEEGLSVRQNVIRAIEFYSVAAEAGHAGAMGKLGAAYVEVGKFTWAAIWSRKAAELSDPGGLYYNGDRVIQDGRKAEEWFQKARDCESGSCFITEYTSRYIDNLSGEELPAPEALGNIGGAKLMVGAAVAAILAAAAAGPDGSGMTAGREPPPGSWQAKFWCYTDFADLDPVD